MHLATTKADYLCIAVERRQRLFRQIAILMKGHNGLLKLGTIGNSPATHFDIGIQGLGMTGRVTKEGWAASRYMLTTGVGTNFTLLVS